MKIGKRVQFDALNIFRTKIRQNGRQIQDGGQIQDGHRESIGGDRRQEKTGAYLAMRSATPWIALLFIYLFVCVLVYIWGSVKFVSRRAPRPQGQYFPYLV